MRREGKGENREVEIREEWTLLPCKNHTLANNAEIYLRQDCQSLQVS